MYNVFKRPMFKRGGSTQGTGIMSHVERRPNYSIGGGVIQGNPMGSRTGFQNPIGTSYNINLGGGGGTPVSMKPNFTLQGSSYVPSSNLPAVINRIVPPRGSPYMGGIYAAAPIAAQTGLAYLNRPRSTEALKYMKEMSEAGVMDETSALDYQNYAEELIKRDKQGKPISFTDAFFLDPETGTYPKIFGRTQDRQTKKAIEDELQAPGSPGYENRLREMEAEKIAQAELDRIVAQEKAEKEKEKEKSKAKDSSYKESEQIEVQKEIETLNEVLGPSISTAEKALLIGKAISSEGSIADKLDVARNEGLKLARQKRKQDRDIALTAYKVAKEKDIAKIKADQPTGTQKTVREFAMLGEKVKAGTASTSEKAIYNAYEKGVFKDDSDTRIQALAIKFAQSPETLTEYQSEIKKLSAIKDRSKREEEKLQTAIKNYTIITNVLKEGGYGSLYGLKEGGRVMKQIGGDAEGKTMEQNNLEVTETSGESNAFPTKPVEKLSFAELRDRLPGEITNDIVQLIANSADALQDFSYIRTQKDINDFNLKYGVNLILPPQKS